GGWTCYGGCYGGGCWGCYGCSGCWGYSYTSCCGCYGGSPYAVVYPAGVPEKPAEKVAPPKGGGDKPPAAEEKPKPGGGEAAAFRSARVVVELPADAKLFIDNQLTKPTSDRRTFNTPSLDHGQAYYYIARAEVTINGKTHTETKQVIVHAGETATARFSELLALTNPPAKPVASAETAKPVATAGR